MSNRTDETRDRVMTSRERENFRGRKVWKDFRTKMKKLFKGKDYLTGSPLTKLHNLHHLDQRKDLEHYTNLDESRFIPLNQQSHDTVHFLYRAWLRDPDVLKRLEEILNLMKEYSND